MIIAFNPTIFDTIEFNAQHDLARIIILITEKSKQHFIDARNLNNVFYKNGHYNFGNHVIGKIFLSNHQQKMVEILIQQQAYMPDFYNNFLTKITIGSNEGEILPAKAYKILSEKSKVIVENGINDWKFIENVCQKYTSHRDRKRREIYKLIKRAMVLEDLESDNAGGHGEIVKVTTKWMENRYKDIHLYKLMVVFDSDRTSNTMFNEIHRGKIAFLKGKTVITDDDYHKYEVSDRIHWHMLYKKKLENYVPLSVLFKYLFTITAAQRIDLESKTHEDLDFIEFATANIGLPEKKIKEQFPELFGKDFSYQALEDKCAHHKMMLALPNGTAIEVSELEQLLLKIAKII